VLDKSGFRTNAAPDRNGWSIWRLLGTECHCPVDDP